MVKTETPGLWHVPFGPRPPRIRTMDDHPASLGGTTLIVGLDDRLVGCRGCCCSRICGLADALRLRRFRREAGTCSRRSRLGGAWTKCFDESRHASDFTIRAYRRGAVYCAASPTSWCCAFKLGRACARVRQKMKASAMPAVTTTAGMETTAPEATMETTRGHEANTRDATAMETPVETTMMKVTMMKEPEPCGNAVCVIRK
jgi:hypothetical protein